MTTTRTDVRPRLPRISLLTTAALLGMSGAALLMLARMHAVAGEAPPPVIALAVVPLLAAAGMLYRRRRAPLAAALTSTLVTAMLAPHLPHTLASPADALFTPFVLLIAFAFSATLLATIATLHHSGRSVGGGAVPRWLSVKLGLVAGLVAGVLAMAAAAGTAASVGIPPELLASLPAVETEKFEFVQQEIRVRAGETVALRLDNRDAVAHSFDVDEFDVHVPMPAHATAVAFFVPDEPGTYTFYCAPHFDRATGKGMKGTLIVEPAT